mmetsp:Transcript_112370/g.204313  ORF Transcript_112370/g.204313 Transcript_112370/m.204313 type:complete len:218 (-) Transcript_112370:143-796(-)
MHSLPFVGISGHSEEMSKLRALVSTPAITSHIPRHGIIVEPTLSTYSVAIVQRRLGGVEVPTRTLIEPAFGLARCLRLWHRPHVLAIGSGLSKDILNTCRCTFNGLVCLQGCQGLCIPIVTVLRSQAGLCDAMPIMGGHRRQIRCFNRLLVIFYGVSCIINKHIRLCICHRPLEQSKSTCLFLCLAWLVALAIVGLACLRTRRGSFCLGGAPKDHEC